MDVTGLAARCLPKKQRVATKVDDLLSPSEGRFASSPARNVQKVVPRRSALGCESDGGGKEKCHQVNRDGRRERQVVTRMSMLADEYTDAEPAQRQISTKASAEARVSKL